MLGRLLLFSPNPSNLLFFLNHANICNTDLKSILGLRHDFIYCTWYLEDLGFIGDTHVRTTTEDNFIGYLKRRSGMNPYGILLDRREAVLQV